jgi:hypothetical protein
VRVRIVVALALVAASATGCGVGDDRDAARAATERFYAAIRAGDGEAACAELADDTAKALESQSGQRCAEAVTELSSEVGAVTGVRV